MQSQSQRDSVLCKDAAPISAALEGVILGFAQQTFSTDFSPCLSNTLKLNSSFFLVDAGSSVDFPRELVSEQGGVVQPKEARCFCHFILTRGSFKHAFEKRPASNSYRVQSGGRSSHNFRGPGSLSWGWLMGVRTDLAEGERQPQLSAKGLFRYL